ncbi:MAG: ABC transporter permease [Clostridium sp.]
MSNNYLDISSRNLKLNKKRSILLVLGIMLSVALMTAMATFFNSISEYQLKQYREEGNYHVAYKGISKEGIELIKNYSGIEEYSIYEFLGEGEVEDKSVNFLECDKTSLIMQGYSIEGELPKNNNEIAINVSPHIKYGKEFKIGDNSKVKINGIENELKITGIITSKYYKQNMISVINSDNEGSYRGIIRFKEDKNLRENIDTLTSKLFPGADKGEVDEHTSLLTMLGAGKYDRASDSVQMLVIILFTIVIVSTVIMIFNAFNITIMERIKEYGLLKAVGSTPSQIRSLVLYEALILGSIGIPLGLIVGYGGLEIFFSLFGESFASAISELEIIFSFKIMAISMGLGFITVMLSAFFPTLRAGKVSPLECINDSTISIKKVPKGRLANKLFKIEGLLAYRNRKINKKKYYITVLAMTVSIAMFIAIAATLKNSYTNLEGYRSIIDSGEITASLANSDPDKLKDYGKTIKSEFDIVEEVVNGYSYMYTGGFSPKEMYDGINARELQDVKINNKDYKKDYISVNVIDKTAEKFLSESIEGFSYDKLVKENGLILITEGKAFNPTSQKYEKSKLNNGKVGDKIIISNFEDNGNQDNINYVKDVYKEKEYSVSYTLSVPEHSNSGLSVYMPIENLSFDEFYYYYNDEDGKSILEKRDLKEILTVSIDVKDNADKDKLKVLRERVNNDFKNNGYVDDVYERNEESAKEILTIKVFVYCFIGIVSLISGLNIINTVSTNILLRKREFSALRAIGTPFSGIRKMLVMEGLMYGFASSVFGIIIGVSLNYYMMNISSEIMDISYSIPFGEIIVAFMGAITLGLISILIPLRKIKNISIIDGIRTLD